MKYLLRGFVIGCSLIIVAIELHAGGALLPGETQPETPSEEVRKNSISNIPSMRIEEPDGTLRPLEHDVMPQSRINMEELEEVPDAGGGSMVNVEGRFRSILQLPEGSNQAIHGHASEESRSSKP